MLQAAGASSEIDFIREIILGYLFFYSRRNSNLFYNFLLVWFIFVDSVVVYIHTISSTNRISFGGELCHTYALIQPEMLYSILVCQHFFRKYDPTRSNLLNTASRWCNPKNKSYQLQFSDPCLCKVGNLLFRENSTKIGCLWIIEKTTYHGVIGL